MNVVEEFIQNGKNALEDAKKLGDAVGFKAPQKPPLAPSPYAGYAGFFGSSSMILISVAVIVGVLAWKKLK